MFTEAGGDALVRLSRPVSKGICSRRLKSKSHWVPQPNLKTKMSLSVS